jgi:hypothetical protein
MEGKTLKETTNNVMRQRGEETKTMSGKDKSVDRRKCSRTENR